jgi:hypothetical protein
MTEFSYPWLGVAAPGSITDGGAYTAFQWNGVWLTETRSGGVVVSGASPLPAAQNWANIGVFYSMPLRYAVTSSGNNLISINTGAGIVDGQFCYNDTAITDTPVISCATPASSRIDRVVLRKNYSAATYTPTATAALTVPMKSTRITTISGADGGAAPALTQDTTRATYWDVPLYQYTISSAGVISSLTDQREFVDAETKYLFLPAIHAYNLDTTTDLYYTVTINYGQPAINLTGSNQCYAYGRWRVPQDFISSIVVKGVAYGEVGGPNVYCRNIYQAGGCGEEGTAHSETGSWAAEAIAASRTAYSCLASLSVGAANTGSIGDMVKLIFMRDANNVLDTLAAGSLKYSGFLIQYFGWR